jgi:hypothetical protein
MPVAVHISPTHMTKEDYERVIGELQARGAADPDGRVFHTAYGEDPVMMFEVWHSQEQFEDHRASLLDAIDAAGVDAAAVVLHPVHSEHPD